MSTGKPIGNNPIFQQSRIEQGSPQEGIEPAEEVSAEEEEQTESVSESAPRE